MNKEKDKAVRDEIVSSLLDLLTHRQALIQTNKILTLLKQFGWKSPDELDEKEVIREQAFKEVGEWLDLPNKGGMYWMSAFVEGAYRTARMERVIDYARPGRGLEVAAGIGESVPIKIFCEEYCPKAKWLFIPEPSVDQLKSGVMPD